ncbi:MAG: hypothetical protein ACI8ZB_001016 [Desulforhopalus sp.]|jgi:hypothetical protein
MDYERNTTIDTCPFWSVDSKKCRVCKDGLFIPLDEHINAYCTSKDHHHCLQYSLHTPRNERSTHQSRQNSTNRRQSIRVTLSNQIQLLKMIKSGEIIQKLSEKAETLDLSSIGMRLQTNVPLIDDTVVQFAFNDNFPEALRKGAGLVEWCNKQIDGPGYQAGISFQSNIIVEAMDVFLHRHGLRA